MGFNADLSIVGGTVLVIDSIQSPNYVAGVSGWIIRQDGTVEFGDGTFRGQLYVAGTNGAYLRGFNDPVDGPTLQMYPGDYSPTSFNFTNMAGLIVTKQAAPHVGGMLINPPGYNAGPVGIYIQGDSFENGYDDAFVSFNNFSGGIQKDFRDLGGGRVKSASLAAISAAVGTTETTVLTIPATVYTRNRCYEIRSKVGAQASVSGAGIDVMVRKTNVAGQLLAELFRVPCPTNALYYGQSGHATFVTGNSTVNAALSVSIRASSGTGTMFGSADGSRSEFSIYDVGDAASQLSDDPGTPVLI